MSDSSVVLQYFLTNLISFSFYHRNIVKVGGCLKDNFGSVQNSDIDLVALCENSIVFSLSLFSINHSYVDLPVGWGLIYCFTDVCVRVSITPITKGTPAQIFCSPGHWLLIFAMTLTFALKVMLWQRFSLEWIFPLFCPKYKEDFGQTCQKAS